MGFHAPRLWRLSRHNSNGGPRRWAIMRRTKVVARGPHCTRVATRDMYARESHRDKHVCTNDGSSHGKPGGGTTPIGARHRPLSPSRPAQAKKTAARIGASTRCVTSYNLAPLGGPACVPKAPEREARPARKEHMKVQTPANIGEQMAHSKGARKSNATGYWKCECGGLPTQLLSWVRRALPSGTTAHAQAHDTQRVGPPK